MWVERGEVAVLGLILEGLIDHLPNLAVADNHPIRGQIELLGTRYMGPNDDLLAARIDPRVGSADESWG